MTCAATCAATRDKSERPMNIFKMFRVHLLFLVAVLIYKSVLMFACVSCVCGSSPV